LIGQMWVNWRAAAVMQQQVLAGRLGNSLGRQPFPAVLCEASHDALVLREQEDASAWPDPSQTARLHGGSQTLLGESVLRPIRHALRDMRR
jgi:hypothetical protein